MREEQRKLQGAEGELFYRAVHVLYFYTYLYPAKMISAI
jgi:hypothetical protein